MVEEFSFGNFWSFKDVQTLNLNAAKIKSKNSNLDLDNSFKIGNDISLLKSKAIYGANASGKSNVLKALSSFIKVIKYSVIDDSILNLLHPFQLSKETENKPAFFQLIFRVDKVRYRYGFEADMNSIKSEWLFSTPGKREQPLFIRENNKIIEINHTQFEEGALYERLFENSKDPIFTNRSLFLTHLASTGFGRISKLVFKSISSITIISGLGQNGMFNYAGESLNDDSKKKFILNFLKKADTGISNIDLLDISKENLPDNLDEDQKSILMKGKMVVSMRTKYNDVGKSSGKSNFSLYSQESEGTIKMFELSPFIYDSLKLGTTLFIDEFDSRFHPLITKKIVELYNSRENVNSQLIFVTHDTNLLSADILRRDQIDFVEKDKYGASHLYSLVEIKGVRNDSSFEKDYIQGRYGAIPYLGDFSKLQNFE